MTCKKITGIILGGIALLGLGITTGVVISRHKVNNNITPDADISLGEATLHLQDFQDKSEKYDEYIRVVSNAYQNHNLKYEKGYYFEKKDPTNAIFIAKFNGTNLAIKNFINFLKGEKHSEQLSDNVYSETSVKQETWYDTLAIIDNTTVYIVVVPSNNFDNIISIH